MIESTLTLRPAAATDADALHRLAELDSSCALSGDVLVAEVDGLIVAAVSPHDGRAIADPFEPTADVVEILRLHAAPARPRPRVRLPRLALPRLAPRFA